MSVFPRQYRATPEEIAAILIKVIPERVSPAASAAEMQRFVTAGYEKARETWRKEAGGTAALRGLYLDTSYPNDLVAPWEDAKALNEELGVYMRKLEAFYADKDAVGLVAY